MNIDLNSRQLEAVQHGNFPLLILAGAGTGKTTTIVNRIEYVIENNSIDPSKILALTFSVGAAENLKKRLSEKAIADSDLITAVTFHSFAKNIIDDNYLELGYSSKPIVVDKDELVYLFLKKINTFNYFKSRRYNRFPVKAIKSLLSLHDQFCQELFDDNLDSVEKYCLDNISSSSNEEDEIYRQIYDAINSFNEFKRIKRESLFIEYEDMIYDFWKLINSHSSILSSLQEQYEFIIIDEFQDNNFAFSEIINKIANHQNITVVGDDDQSIYSFRGSNSYNMYDFHKFYSKNPNYKKIELIKNYRSNQKILDVANSVIRNNENRMEKDLLVAAFDDSDSNLVDLCIGDVSSQLKYLTGQITLFLQEDNEATIAVLCRTHFDCKTISTVLNQNNISHNYKNDKLFEQRIIKDIIALLNIIADSKYALHSLVRLGRFKFSKKFTKNIIDLSDADNLLLRCINNRKLFTGVEYDWLNKIQSISNKNTSYNELFDKISEFILKGEVLSEIDVQSLNVFKEIVCKFDGFYKKDSLKNFCDYINLLLENNTVIVKLEKPNKKSIINLMTVHNSKGMEFDYVFLPFLQSSKFPQANKSPEFINSLPADLKKWRIHGLDKKTYHLEEERRLFYVAITRARIKLCLFTTKQRQSKFIKEIDENLYTVNEIEGNIASFSKDDIYRETYEDDLQDVLYLSASKLDNYNKCQLRYKYSSLDSIPYFKYNSFFALGNIIHKVLQDFHENTLSGYDNIMDLLNKHWNDKLYFYDCESRQYKKDAQDMLINYLSYLEKNVPSPVLFEHFFKIKMKNYVLSGVIDRVDIDDQGNITIYDYKTSKTQKSNLQIKNSFQLPIYALAVYLEGESMHNQIRSYSTPILAGELSLRFNDLERAIELSDNEIHQIERKIDELAKQISSNIFKANPTLMNCTYCDYKKFICSYYD